MESNTKTKLSDDLIKLILKKHFGLNALLEDCQEVTSGWFNALYLLRFSVNGNTMEVALKTGLQRGKYTLRYELDMMKAELHVYDTLASTKIPIPTILARDFSYELIDAPYFIMEKLQGCSWEEAAEELTDENYDLLLEEQGRYLGILHQIQGEWFGYLKDDPNYQHPTWTTAFKHMVEMVVEDGKATCVDLPYDTVMEALAPHWQLFDEIKTPSLVNFDMWMKNIMVIKQNDRYVIDGIIDHERAFYGDPYADFVAVTETAGGIPIDLCFSFIRGYEETTGKPFVYTYQDKLRYYIYEIYLTLIMGTEVYRYNEEDTKNMLSFCREELNKFMDLLKNASTI